MSKYEITDNKTGKTVVVEGNRAPTPADAEAIFQKAGLRQAAQAPQEQPNLFNKVMDVLSIPSYAVGGMLDRAHNEGIQAFNPLKNPFGIPAAIEGVKSKKSVMQELPETLKMDPESLPGMAVGLAGEIATPDPLDVIKFGKVAEKIVTKVGKGTEKAGEDLVLKGLKPSPSQQRKFLEKTGETLSDFLSKNKITDNFVEKAGKKIDEIQGAFDEIAKNKNLQVDPNLLLNKFIENTSDFSDSVVGSVQKKAKDVEKVYDNIVAKYGDKLTVFDLTKERKAIDKLLKESQFGMDVEAASYLRSVRNAIQDTVQEATKDITYQGKNLKNLGLELRKLYEFEKIATQQSGLGKGTLPIGITDLLSLGAGSMVGDDPLERVKNALLGLGIKKVANNPKVISGVSKTLEGAGKFLQTPAITKSLEAIMRAGKELGINAGR